MASVIRVVLDHLNTHKIAWLYEAFPAEYARDWARRLEFHTYRLVQSRREGIRVRQITRLNLERYFELAEAQWPLLCARLDQWLSKQETLLPVDLPERVESLAQKLAGHLVTRAPAAAAEPAYAEVDVNSVPVAEPRSVGVEHVALYALVQLGLEPVLAALGINALAREP
ncbi:MAG: hypothetical protein ACRERU_01240 [Methylococcales bacterium]